MGLVEWQVRIIGGIVALEGRYFGLNPKNPFILKILILTIYVFALTRVFTFATEEAY